MRKENYIMKSAAVFRKAYKLPEHKEDRLSVFLDASILERSDLPKEVIRKAIEAAQDGKYGLTRLNDFCMCGDIVANDGLQYYVDLESKTYTVLDHKTWKRLYSVIQITGYRYAAYKANIYGVYEGYPVKGNLYNWETGFHNNMYDLFYKEGVESNVVAAY